MAYLLIKKVRYQGDRFYYESPDLTEGINIIEGPNGAGKSTFMNLIYYCIGGDVPEFNPNQTRFPDHTEIVSDINNKVELAIEIEGINYSLTRLIRKNDVFVVQKGKEEEGRLYPINRKGEDPIFSDWLLEKLNIEVVEIYQGATNYKLNAKDLFRLIYHNQELDPSKVYKSPDSENYLTDSELMRKTIFQLLVGETFSEYYKVLAQRKKIEKDRGVAKSVLDEFILVITNLSIGREKLNATFLKESLEQKINQVDKLYNARKSLKENRPQSSESGFSNVKKLKIEIARIGAKIEDLESDKRVSVNELIKFQNLKEDFILEVTQISKIIHTHESLSLFSMDTCPYCLKDVDRKENTCICGTQIDESEYQRFFYTSEEYMDILKSKQKSVKTVNLAIDSVRKEVDGLGKKIEKLSKQYSSKKDRIRKVLLEIEAGLDIKKLDEVDDKILELKQEMILVEQLIDQEEKREKYQKKFDSLDRQYKRLQLKENELKARASADMLDKVDAFNLIYNELMTTTLKNCKIAKIDNLNYMPVINNGEYREASSSVSIRLMYYLTLLSMSLKDSEIRFPRLLLIDTPKTGGIDDLEIDKLLGKISEELKEVKDSKYQVILTTGVQTYPPEYEKFVFRTLADNDRLLIERN